MLQNCHFVDAKVELFAKYGSAQWARHRRVSRHPHADHQLTPVTAPARRLPRPAPRPARRGRHRHLQRHRRRHLHDARFRRDAAAERHGDARRLGARRRAGVCRRAGVRGAGGVAARRPAASTSTCARASAASPAFLTGWTSFVAGFSGAIAAGAVAVAGVPRSASCPGAGDAPPLAAWHLGPLAVTVSVARARRDRRHRRPGARAGARRRPRPRAAELADDAQGRRAGGVRGRRASSWPGLSGGHPCRAARRCA